MTYSSQQLADALQELSKEPVAQDTYGTSPVSAVLDAKDRDLVFPPSVAEFLDEMKRYGESAKSISVGVY